MDNQESVYLYSDDQKPLYGNLLEELEHRTCPHTHTVYALMDVEESEIPKSMANHVASCKECQRSVLLNQSIAGQIEKLIPSTSLTRSENLEKNIKAIFYRSEFSLLSRFKSEIEAVKETLLENLKDIFSVIFSIRMGVTYLAATLTILFLNWIF